MLKRMLPMEIEDNSFKIISEELKGKYIDPQNELVLKRVIHTSADFDYYDNLIFSKDVVKKTIKLLQDEEVIVVSDTTMVQSGINKKHLALLNGITICYIQDEDVARMAKEKATTRSSVAIDKSLELDKKVIYAIGNAPTALIRIHQLVKEGKLKPALIIAVPVGFVNVVESKELIKELDVPYIIALGRKGGSNVAASIINALIYQAYNRDNV